MMYLEYFKLKLQPFSEHAAVNSLWMDQRMKEALARLEFLVSHATLGLVTGPNGVGKSAMLKRFLSKLPQQCEAIYCHLTHLPSAGLFKVLVSQMGEVPRRGKDRLFDQIYQAAKRSEGRLLLVIDEAHLLDGDALIDLRLLVSSAVVEAPPLKILLVGQHPLSSIYSGRANVAWGSSCFFVRTVKRCGRMSNATPTSAAASIAKRTTTRSTS
ncbi:MAG: general secretion pathway protein A [Pirellulaceae bacterium]|jgi:general secretion pathway protein A